MFFEISTNPVEVPDRFYLTLTRYLLHFWEKSVMVKTVAMHRISGNTQENIFYYKNVVTA